MAEAHIVVMEENEIVVDPDLLKSIACKLNTLGKRNEADDLNIFPVPYSFRQSKENLFEPSAVSIGPFHHGRTRVQPMEEQKCRSLRDFLSRGDHITLDLCLSEIMKLEERTRRCYSESVPLDSNSFAEMMLLDGCFVLEYFLKWYEHRLAGSVFVLLDLLLLENQIPFFIVEKLCEIGLKPEDRMNFTNYLLNAFARAGPAVLDDSFPKRPDDQIHHFIHLCYHCSIPINLSKPVVSSSKSFVSNSSIFQPMLSRVLTRIFPKRNSLSSQLPNSTQKSSMVIPCATELKNAGIMFRPKSNPCHLLDISFDYGVLKIPRLSITNGSKTLLANLIAFEQYKSDKLSTNLSSFALFLYSLVKTPEDVKILQQYGIINNYLDSDKELIDFFNQICKGMAVENDHLLAKLFQEVNKFCESNWNRHRQKLMQDYFSDPWKLYSFVGGVVFAVALSFVQTFYTVYAYYFRRS